VKDGRKNDGRDGQCYLAADAIDGLGDRIGTSRVRFRRDLVAVEGNRSPAHGRPPRVFVMKGGNDLPDSVAN